MTKNKITLQCLYCGKRKDFPEESLEAQGVFNFFCTVDCEDKYAWFEESYKPSHKNKKGNLR